MTKTMRILRRVGVSAALIALILWTLAAPAPAEVLLDVSPVETRLAHLLPDHADENSFHYIPKTPRVATWPDGRPKFTLLQYARTGKDISGGLLHFLVTYGLTQEEVQQTERDLQRLKPDGRVVGPVPFVEGDFHIISASAGPNSEFTRRIVGTGAAPLLAGQEAAVSIALTEEGSTLLLESFKRPTSDVSVQFVLTYEGLTAPFEAVLTVDWDKVYSHRSFKASTGIPLMSHTISKVYEELTEQGAINLEVTGDDENMEGLLDSVYSTLIEKMFAAQPIKPEDLGKTGGPGRGWVQRLLGGQNMGYYMRDIRMTGTYRVDMKRRKRDRRQIPMTGNIGDIYERFGGDEEMFGFVDLDDPAFEKRSIQVILDGENLDSFGEFINFAGARFRRQHDRADALTQGATIFDRAAFAGGGNKQLFTYLRKQDEAPGWLDYEYQTVWSFRGGVEVEGEWSTVSSDVITLRPPYRYRRLEVLADAVNLEERDVLRIAVMFRHRYQGMESQREVTLKSGEPLNALYSYLTSPDDLDYEYRMTFLMRNGERIETDWTKSSDPFVYAYAPRPVVAATALGGE